MANEFYTPSGYPSTNSFGASGGMRAELASVMAGFDKFPIISTAGLKMLRVNAAGTAVEAVDGALTFLTIAAAAAGYLPLHGTADAAATATKLTTPRTIGGVAFDGTANIAVTLAATATALATARTIGGTSFDGTGNISVALAATATALATARTIGGTSFDGTSNIAVALAANATQLQTARTINGVNFDGTGNITINAVDATARLALSGGTMGGVITSTIAGDNFRIANSAGYISGYNTANTTRTGFLQFNAGSDVTLAAENSAVLNFTTAGASRLYIDASGNVGIGTTPTAALELARGAAANAEFVLRGNGVAYGSGFSIQMHSDNDAYLFHRANANMLFATNALERMRITAAGLLLDGAGIELGWKIIPKISGNPATATTAVRGCFYDMSGALTLPSAVFAAGDCFSFFNGTGSPVAITQGAGLSLRSALGIGSRTLAANCIATVLYVTSGVGVISGSGLS